MIHFIFPFASLDLSRAQVGDRVEGAVGVGLLVRPLAVALPAALGLGDLEPGDRRVLGLGVRVRPRRGVAVDRRYVL